jgi:AcrR family transcriptional regulator
MIRVAAERGYQEATIADVIADAGISRKTYYELFRDKEDCFLAAYDSVSRRYLDAFGDAYRADPKAPWIERMRNGLGSLFDEITADPDAARLFIVEALAAGPRSLNRRNATIRELTRFVDAGRHETSFELPGIASLAIVGGINELLYAEASDGSFSHLHARLPEVVYWVAQPFLGEERADEERRRATEWARDRQRSLAA